MELIVFLVLMSVGFVVGGYYEQKHYASIRAREKKTLQFPIMTFGAKQELPYKHEVRLSVGSVVIANDYFKTFSATLRNLVGGRVTAYESLLDRGRREAVLRMKEDAIAWGASQVLNVRFETATISGQTQGGSGVVEVIAYGTAVR